MENRHLILYPPQNLDLLGGMVGRPRYFAIALGVHGAPLLESGSGLENIV